MLNADACQARMKSGCIIFSSPLENQFVLHHSPSAPQLEFSGASSRGVELGLPFPGILREAHTGLYFKPFVSVCLLYLNILH